MSGVEISSSSGRVTVVAEERDDVVVEGAEATSGGGVTRVNSHSGSVVVRCPVGTDVRVGSASGRVVCVGRLGELRLTTASGRVEVEHATDADVRSSSGSVIVGRCDGECRIAVSSGRVEVAETGHLVASTRSGRIDVGQVDSADVRVASGNVEIAATGAGDIAVSTRSGSVVVTLPAGVRPSVDAVSDGRPRILVDEGEDCRVIVRARGGKVTVAPR